MKNYSFKKAFTLAEATITLFMLGVIVAIMIPAITNISPSPMKVGFRNAYNITSTTIDSIINNEILYPSEKTIDSTNTPIPQGFFYTTTGTKSSSATVNDSETNDLAWEYEAYTRQCLCTNGGKLVRLFCCSLNVSTALCTANQCDISTNNGMTWTIAQNTNCTTDSRNTVPYMTVQVDVNGPGKPNSMNAREPDRYKFNIFYNGRIELDNNSASSASGLSYLETPTENKKKNF